jgi:hypothetical protein
VSIEELKLARLIKACKKSRLDFIQLLNDCKNGAAQFHDSEEACAITTLHVSGQHKVCYVVALGGTLTGARELLPQIEEFARSSGCQVVQGTCRPGVDGVDSQGYRAIATVYEKTL